MIIISLSDARELKAIFHGMLNTEMKICVMDLQFLCVQEIVLVMSCLISESKNTCIIPILLHMHTYREESVGVN